MRAPRFFPPPFPCVCFKFTNKQRTHEAPDAPPSHAAEAAAPSPRHVPTSSPWPRGGRERVGVSPPAAPAGARASGASHWGSTDARLGPLRWGPRALNFGGARSQGHRHHPSMFMLHFGGEIPAFQWRDVGVHTPPVV